MKRLVIAVLALVFLSGASMAIAQMQPTKPAQPSQGQAPGAIQKPGAQPQQPMMGQGMMGHGMMGMMCPMMGQPMMGMGPGMMGGMMATSDPKAQARMLKLHGDMMKAMGEVMLKHAQSLEQEK